MNACLKLPALVLGLAATCAVHAEGVSMNAAGVATLGQMAVRDAATGRLRAATPQEAATLQAAGSQALRAALAAPNLTRTHRSGAVGARLTDRSLSAVVVLRQPDGKLVEYCFAGRDAADAALALPAPVPAANPLPTE